MSEEVRDADLRVDSSLDGDVVGLRLAGSADARSMKSLGAVVSLAAAAARRPGIREILVDLRELEFMNSSCFKHFVTWICAVQEAPASAPHFRFVSDPKRLWQRRSLHALTGLAEGLVSVEA